MLFGNAHVETAVGHLAHHDVEGAACGHGRGNPDDFGIRACQLQNGVSEHILEFGRHAGLRVLEDFTGFRVKLSGGMPDGLVGFRFLETFAFDCNAVQDFGTLDVFQVTEHLDQVFHIMPVHRTEVTQSHSLKKIAPLQQHALDAVVDVLDKTPHAGTDAVEFPQDVPDVPFDFVVGFRRGNVQQVVVDTADIRVNRHVVVVEHHQQVRTINTRIVQCLECHASRHRTVADDGNRLPVLLAVQLGCHCHAQGGRNRRGGMPRAKRVVLTLATARETADAAVQAFGLELLLPPGQNLMGIRLVPYVPNDVVVRRVKHIMKRYREFHRSQAGAQMPRIFGTIVYDFLPNLTAHLGQLFLRHLLQVCRRIDMFKHAHKSLSTSSREVNTPQFLFLRLPSPAASCPRHPC